MFVQELCYVTTVTYKMLWFLIVARKYAFRVDSRCLVWDTLRHTEIPYAALLYYRVAKHKNINSGWIKN